MSKNEILFILNECLKQSVSYLVVFICVHFYVAKAKAHCGQPVYPYTDLTLISLKKTFCI